MSSHHYFQGRWIDDAELERRVGNLGSLVTRATIVESSSVVDAADRLASKLTDPSSPESARLKACLLESGAMPPEEIEPTLREVSSLLRREALGLKLRRELGSSTPQLVSRVAYDEDLFEAWAPLGLLVHISPQNSFATGAMSVIEGLLAGNVNFLKTGAEEGLFAQHFLEALVESDRTGTIRDRVIAARIPSSKTDLLFRIFEASDGIAAWGGEESIDKIRKLAPPQSRLIEWGHRISFAYVAAGEAFNPDLPEQIARECCLFEQSSCSSPQCIYVDTADWEALNRFADALGHALEQVSPTVPRDLPGDREAAEISMVTECHRLEACLGKARLIEGSDRSWRILVDSREPLAASPLFRSIWVKPLPRERIVEALRPMRRYLQTAGLACGLTDVAPLSRLLFAAGVHRIRGMGQMQGSYAGEPHDGLYALQRYSRRISIQMPCESRGISAFDELESPPQAEWADAPPVTPKEAFTAGAQGAQLFFKSGGSSGEPKLSTFSYEQYDGDMRLGAEGLYAAGLDPVRDRAMNLFFSGGLYGGFLSIFSSLERLRAVQFPMAAHPDLEMVAKTIIENQVNALLGMPSYLMTLFEKNAAAFEKYGGIEKIFYGGEHFTETQRKKLIDRFGVRLIRSGAYGSVDIGPMGYQCEHCEGGVHHLQQRLHRLEIFKTDSDVPVDGEEAGRLVFSPRSAASNKPRRYAIGDIGHWVLDPGGRCPCGRSAPRFKLLGRSGDIFRIGSIFLNYRKFAAILATHADYAGELQVRLDEAGTKERVILRIARGHGLSAESCAKSCLENYADLDEAVRVDGVLLFEVEELASSAFERSRASGKLLRIVDTRRRR